MQKSKGKRDDLLKLRKKTGGKLKGKQPSSAQKQTDTAETALQASEHRYLGLFKGMTEGFALHEIICDRKGKPCDYRFLEINPAFEELTGLKSKDVIGKTVREVLPDNDSQWVEIYGRVALTGKSVQFDSHSTPLNKDYEVFAYSPAPRQFAVLFTDITERKKREKELHQLNRTLRALSKSSQAMMKAVDEQAYLEQVCKIIIEDCGHKMVWIGYAEDDKHKSVRPVAYSGFEDGYLETLKLTWADTERGRGPTGTAIRTGKVSMCRNMLTDPKFKPWRKEAIKRGYASSIVLPLKNVYKIFGAMSIYSKEPDPFSEDEIKLLQELADDFAYGITILRLRAAQKQAEDKLQESNEELAATNEELATSNEELRATQEQMAAQNLVLEGINKIFHEAMTCKTEEELGRTCLIVAEEITQSKFGFIGEINAQGLEDIAISDPGWAACKTAIPKGHTGYKTVPGGFKIHGIYGRVIKDGKGFFTNDPPSHPDSIGTPQGHPDLKAFLGVPLKHSGKTIGMVAVGNREGGYRQEDLESMEALSGTIVEAFMRFRAEKALRESEHRERERAAELATMLDAVPTPVIIVHDPQALHMTGNRATDELLRNPRNAEVSLSAPEEVRPRHFKAIKDGRELRLDELPGQRAARGKHVEDFEFSLVFDDGTTRDVLGYGTPLLDEQGHPRGAVHVLVDITERKRAEANQLLMAEILRILNRGGGDMDFVIGEMLRLIRESTGFDAVGLRLRKEDDYPYYEQNGFSEEFLQQENFLCAKGEDGYIIRDADGRVILECTCGLVLSGCADPSMPCFTEGGSFWTNVSSELLALAPKADPRTNPRNRCIHAGYQSVGLFPVRSGEEIIGLLQLNGRREGRFNPELIRFFESLADNIGLALKRKQAEEALRENREQLDLALISSRMATFDWDIVNNKRTWSNGVHTLLGTKPETFTGTAEEFFQIIHPEDRSTVQAALAKAVESTGLYETEYRAVWPDGSIHHIAARGKIHRDNAGRAVLMTGVCWDITERRQAEDALRESEERLNRSQEIAHLGSWELDLISNRLTWSDEVYRIFGLKPQEFGATYEAFLERVHPDDRAAVDEAYSGSLRDNRDTYEVEHRVIRKSTGEIRVVHEKCEHFRDATGKIIRSVGMVSDITERKQAEDAVKTSERRFRTLSEAVPGIVWTAEPDGVTDYYNQRWYEYSGLPADAPESAWQETIHPDDKDNLAQAWDNSVRTGAVYNIEHRIRRFDGQYRWHLSRAIPLRDVSGKIIKWFGMSMDIDEQKRALEELERISDELEGKNDELESIIRTASHDLRSPLVNIKGFSGELAKDIHNAEELLKTVQLPQNIDEKISRVFSKYVPEAVSFIQNSAESINQMLKNLTQVAKAGTVPISVRDIDMNTAFSKISENLHFKLKESGGKLEVEPLPDCRGDSDQIIQVFTNLIDNAIKYREPARPTLIRVYGSADKDKATYCVEDNGKGISEEYHEKIFNLFTRLDPEVAKGDGLGLTIAKRIVERQGGKIWLHSDVGKGSKFFVMMPR